MPIRIVILFMQILLSLELVSGIYFSKQHAHTGYLIVEQQNRHERAHTETSSGNISGRRVLNYASRMLQRSALV